MNERLPEDIAFDFEYMDQYIAIRVDIVRGKHIGRLLEHFYDAEPVHAAIKVDQRDNPEARYLFYPPGDSLTERAGWTIWKED